MIRIVEGCAEQSVQIKNNTLGKLIILYVIIISSDIGIYYVRMHIMTLYEAQQADNYDEVDGIEIDGTWYTIIDIIDEYYYLMDLDNKDDFLLFKDDGDDLVSITDENEFNSVLAKFREKHMNTTF